jgi:hypothetical protein
MPPCFLKISHMSLIPCKCLFVHSNLFVFIEKLNLESVNFNPFLPLHEFHMSLYDGIPNDQIYKWNLIEHVYTFCIHVHHAILQNISYLQPL